MKKLYFSFTLCFIFTSISISYSQNNTSKYAPNIINHNMDWYQITFDVELDNNDTLNTALINSINFNNIEHLRLENQDVEVELEIEGTEIEIILFSYHKCAFLKNGINTNPIKE